MHYRCDINRWLAQIGVHYKKIYLGAFEDEVEAAKVYDEAAKKYYGEFAYLNFPAKRKQKGLKPRIARIPSLLRYAATSFTDLFSAIKETKK